MGFNTELEDLIKAKKRSLSQMVRWCAKGCELEPIASYLKAAGLLRRLPNSKGWWEEGQFWIECELTLGEAIAYLAEEAELSPVLNPWNGSCGLWKADKLISQLEEAPNHSRIQKLIGVIQQARNVIQKSGLKKQPSKGEAKTKLIKNCQSEITEPDWHLWQQTVLELVDEKNFLFSRLLGTGGNVGAKDLGYNYLEAWAQLIDLSTGEPRENAITYWRAAITGESCPGSLSESALLAQYSPAADFVLDGKSYPYQKSGGSSTAMANPADAVLLIEGLHMFSIIAKRKLESEEDLVGHYSLAVNLAVGTADTAVSGELRAGVEEFWLPIWNEPKSFQSLRNDLLDELRGPLPRQKVPDSFDFVALLVSKAESRKIPLWQRYAFFPRKGQSNFAISLGTFNPKGHNLGAELDGYRRALSRFAYSERAPGKLRDLARQLESQLFALASGHGQILRLLRLLGEIELYLARSPTSQENIWPVSQLKKEWVERALKEATSPTVRLALSLGSLWLRSRISNARPNKKGGWFWSQDPVEWGADLASNLLTMQRRWQMLASVGTPAYPELRISPTFADLSAFLSGQVDPIELTAFAAGFSLCQMPANAGFQSESAAYDLLKLPTLYLLAAYCQWSQIGIGPVMNQLAQGNDTLAARSAAQRLRAHQINPFDIPASYPDPRLIAAALAFPLAQSQLNTIKTYLMEK